MKSNSIILMQARFNSSRLPGKALFPIKGIPIIVLAALRASNTGKKIVVLTSHERTDDEICNALDRYNIAYFRGNLENVLERFYSYISEMEDDNIIFRLTADNILPDGKMLDEMENEFIKYGVDIMGCTPEFSNLPYGVSAEIMTVKSLKNAFYNSKEYYDKEHVTSYIYKNGTYKYFKSSVISGLKNFRMTIDTIDDYFSVKSLFNDINDINDIVNISSQQLMNNFQKMNYRPFYESAPKPMTLGTVQFGIDYGIVNRNGVINKKDSIEIIRQAITEGIEYIDTASAYGCSESVIGEALKNGWSDRVKIITKLTPFSEDEYNDDKSWRLATRCAVYQSCLNLNTKKINTVMLHRASHLLNKSIINELKTIKEEGIISNIGVSIENPNELCLALSCTFISVIQMPFNILDYRWFDFVETIVKEKDKRSLIIHARSSLLQGILGSKDKCLWNKVGVNNHEEIWEWLNLIYKRSTTMSISDLCIRYVNSQKWIDSVVVGVDSIEQLYSNMQSISMPIIDDKTLDYIKKHAPKLEHHSLNPATWSK